MATPEQIGHQANRMREHEVAEAVDQKKPSHLGVVSTIAVAVISALAGAYSAYLTWGASIEGSGTTWDIERTKTVLELAKDRHDVSETGQSYSDWVCYYAMAYDCTTQVWNADGRYYARIDEGLCPPEVPPFENEACPYEPIPELLER